MIISKNAQVFAEYVDLPKVTEQNLWELYNQLKTEEDSIDWWKDHYHVIYLLVLEGLVKRLLGR